MAQHLSSGADLTYGKWNHIIFSRSSATNIPINMQLFEILGLNKDFYPISIPLGATINIEYATVTITVMTLAVCNMIGIIIPLPVAILLCIISTLTTCGSSDVA